MIIVLRVLTSPLPLPTSYPQGPAFPSAPS